MSFPLPRWQILINGKLPTAEVRCVTANNFEAAVKGAVLGYRYRRPGARVETWEMVGIMS